jgi:NAD+ dependent glucose-6-phosphate dehydrogenase
VEAAPSIYRPGHGRVLDHDSPVRPDSLYGVSKAYGEALGRYYSEQHGLRVFCLRIGAVEEHDDPARPLDYPLVDLDEDERRERMAAIWLSRRDCASLVGRCLEVEDVSWALVYGVSGNPRRFWDLEHARALLGWEPQDSAPGEAA